MYEAYFNLTDRPFAAVPRSDHYFPSAASDEARNNLTRAIDRGEGAGLVVGPAGSGKTLLCQILAEHFRDVYRVALLAGTPLGSPRALLQAILYELGQPYRRMDEGELRLALTDFVTVNKKCGPGIVLLVDDAHLLSLRLMDEIGRLTNLTRDNQPAVRLVLAGGQSLEERFTSPRLASFSQRLAARCYLQPFTRQETQEYLHTRIAACGAEGRMIFPPETCQMIHKLTEGIPRLINQVCDHVLLLAYAGGAHQIESPHIEEAWADLQQLPAPTTAATTTTTGDIIEFGGLDDDMPASEAGATSEPVPEIDAELELTAVSDDAGEWGPEERLRHIQNLLTDVAAEFRPAGSIGPEVELRFEEDPFREEFADEETIADRYSAPAATAQRTTAPGRQATETVPQLAEAPAETGRPETLPLRLDRTVAWQPAVAESLAPLEEDEEPLPWAPRAIVAVGRQEYGRLFAGLRKRG